LSASFPAKMFRILLKIPAAIGALRHELEANKNSELAYQIVRDIGVFPPARIQQPSSPYDSDTRVK